MKEIEDISGHILPQSLCHKNGSFKEDLLGPTLIAPRREEKKGEEMRIDANE